MSIAIFTDGVLGLLATRERYLAERLALIPLQVRRQRLFLPRGLGRNGTVKGAHTLERRLDRADRPSRSAAGRCKRLLLGSDLLTLKAEVKRLPKRTYQSSEKYKAII